MPYTSNTPQANQQIAATQPDILANFGFLSTGLVVDHHFDAAGSGSNMYHEKASMPSNALSPALPAGTAGTYFVNGTDARYYDGTDNWFLNEWTVIEKGTVTLGAINTFVEVGSAIPADQIGEILLYQDSSIWICAQGTFRSDSGPLVYTFINGGQSVNYIRGRFSSGLTSKVQIESNNTNASGKTFIYIIKYRPA